MFLFIELVDWLDRRALTISQRYLNYGGVRQTNKAIPKKIPSYSIFSLPLGYSTPTEKFVVFGL